MEEICHILKEHITLDQLKAHHDLSITIAMELVIIIAKSSVLF